MGVTELTQAEFVLINQAFDAAIRAAQSPMLAAQQLLPIAGKLKSMVAQPKPAMVPPIVATAE